MNLAELKTIVDWYTDTINSETEPEDVDVVIDLVPPLTNVGIANIKGYMDTDKKQLRLRPTEGLVPDETSKVNAKPAIKNMYTHVKRAYYTCPKCDNKIAKNDYHCKYCGQKLAKLE